VTAEALETLLEVQDRDLAIDRLRHRRATLPERAALEQRLGELAERRRVAAEIGARRAELLALEHRLDDEAARLGARIDEVDQRLYSGTVTSPRELQAMQADLDMLRRQRSELEDRELECMEQREAADAQLAAAEAAAGELAGEVERLQAVIAAAEADIDGEIAAEQAARDALAARVGDALLRDYEQRRARNQGVGIARLVGTTCQACHLTIPSTEAERIRRAGGAQVASCDNCGAILVP
jgi:predicted  nucleic acid-binding Zn-ribbon protein